MASSAGTKTRLAKQKSQSVVQALDPRAVKTRRRIAEAFAALLGRRSYGLIRVSDITRRAQVGRATFYAHFASKDALLSAELVRVPMTLLTELPGEPCLVDCSQLFAHVQHASQVYRLLTAGPGGAVGARIIQDALEARVAALLADQGAHGAAPAFVPRFIASTIMTLIAWSLEQPVVPAPAKLQEVYRTLAGGALAARKA
jgi:AcrR family transcriptional regulator